LCTEFGVTPPVLVDESISLRRGEVVALIGPNGIGKTTMAKVAAGLLAPGGGRVLRFGRAAYLPQDPGRYLITETVFDEVALAAGARGNVRTETMRAFTEEEAIEIAAALSGSLRVAR